MMTLDEIAAAEARAKAATEGPWRVDLWKHPNCDISFNILSSLEKLDMFVAKTFWKRDEQFIAHARTDVPALCATARTAIDLLQRLKGRVAINCAEVKDVDAFLAAVAQKGGAIGNTRVCDHCGEIGCDRLDPECLKGGG